MKTQKISADEAARKLISDFNISGGAAQDFVISMFGRVTQHRAQKLVPVLADVLKADKEEAHKQGVDFETTFPVGLRSSVQAQEHLNQSTAPTSRDRAFAQQMPPSLRDALLKLTQGEMRYAYRCGQREVEEKRMFEQLDRILANPAERGAFFLRTYQNAHLRDPLMFP